ncbi:MAG: restriction endonuclease subunit S [Paraclostridium sp.]
MNKTPKLRFKEFSGDWESKKVVSVFDRVSNKVDVIEDEYYEQIGIRSHGKGIFYKEPVSGKELGNKRVFWVEPDVFIVNIVFAWEQAVAKTTQNEVGMIASHRFPMYRPKENILDLYYITQLFKTPKGKFLLGLASPGGAGRNKTLGQKEFDNLDIVLPSYDEQKKISTFISLIDKKIIKQGEKVEALKDYKNGLMKKVFSRELRFKDDGGTDYPEWKNKKVLKLGDIITGNTPSKSEDKYYKINNGYKSFPWITPTDIKYSKDIYSGATSITEEGVKVARILPVNTVLVTCIASIGKNAILKMEGSCNQQINAIIPNKDNDCNFIYYLMEYKKDVLKKFAGMTATPILNKTDFSNLKFKIPNDIKEQKKIAELLEQIDKKLEKNQEKLDFLNEYKKGLLQQMFV